MLSGKKSVRALRNATEEILKPSLIQADEELDLIELLDEKATKSKTARPRVNCLDDFKVDHAIC